VVLAPVTALQASSTGVLLGVLQVERVMKLRGLFETAFGDAWLLYVNSQWEIKTEKYVK